MSVADLRGLCGFRLMMGLVWFGFRSRRGWIHQGRWHVLAGLLLLSSLPVCWLSSPLLFFVIMKVPQRSQVTSDGPASAGARQPGTEIHALLFFSRILLGSPAEFCTNIINPEDSKIHWSFPSLLVLIKIGLMVRTINQWFGAIILHGKIVQCHYHKWHS